MCACGVDCARWWLSGALQRPYSYPTIFDSAVPKNAAEQAIRTIRAGRLGGSGEDGFDSSDETRGSTWIPAVIHQIPTAGVALSPTMARGSGGQASPVLRQSPACQLGTWKPRHFNSHNVNRGQRAIRTIDCAREVAL